MCRKTTGAAFATYVGFPVGAVSWTNAPTRFRSSPDVERSFCSRCGSTIGFHRAHETTIHLGSLDRPDLIASKTMLNCHLFTADRVSWLQTTDDWPRYPAFPPGRAEELKARSGREILGWILSDSQTPRRGTGAV